MGKQRLTVLLLVLVAVALTACTGRAEEPEDMQALFPSLHITSALDPFHIERELWHAGSIALTGAGNLSFEPVETQLRGRGNSTWRYGPDKRPLRFRLDEPMSILGSPYEATDWILLSNHFDRSLLRNYAALHLGTQMGRMAFTPVPHHLHLYVNGAYMGVYLLTDERDVTPGRMELTWDSDPAVSEYFLELDQSAPVDAVEDEDFVIVTGLPYDVRWAGSSRRRTPEHVAYAKAYLEAVSLAIRQQNFDEILALIDLDTFVDFYIIHELFKEPDILSRSVFMHIRGQGDERRLFKGPIWDFDLTAGNTMDLPTGDGPELLYAAVVNYWYRHLMQMPAFLDAVTARWDEIKDAEIADTIDHIASVAARYEAEFERNFERHPILGRATWRTRPALAEIDSFAGHVDYLIDWLSARAAWMDDFFHGRLGDHDPLQAFVVYHTEERPLRVHIQGEYHPLPVSYIMLHDTALLPLHELAALFDAAASHDPETGVITLTRRDVTITHEVNTSRFLVNDTAVEMVGPSLLIRGAPFLPLRPIAAALGYDIQWNRAQNIVILTNEVSA